MVKNGQKAKGPHPSSSSSLPYSGNVKLTARLSGLAVRKIYLFSKLPISIDTITSQFINTPSPHLPDIMSIMVDGTANLSQTGSKQTPEPLSLAQTVPQVLQSWLVGRV